MYEYKEMPNNKIIVTHTK